jgi:exosortase
MKPPAPGCTAFRALPWPAQMNAAILCAAVAALAALLWPLWLHDANLTHGMFLPLLTGILVYESRRDATPRFIGAGAWPVMACALLVILSLCAFAVAVVYAAALGWIHVMAEFMLSASLVLALGAAWLGFADERVRFIPLNWAAAVAAILWIFAGQPPPGTYARLAFFLQSEVTTGVTHVLGAIGIAAYQNGNVIELARTSVGVSEACSGVRSLISCTVAGLFLSALLVRRPGNRILLIVLSPLIGLAMNFLRSLLLTLIANSGVKIEGPWHDITGGSILVATTVLVAALGLWLHRRESELGDSEGHAPAAPAGFSLLQAIVGLGLVSALVTGGLFVVGSRPSRTQSRPAPDLSSLLPEAPPGWISRDSEMSQYSDILHTHTLVERVYSAGSAVDSPHLTLYLAYWRPGEAAVSLVDAHTPDACWPGTGWEAEPVPNERASLGIDGRSLATAECRMFARDRFMTYVWFWHLHGGRPITYVDPYSAIRLLGLAWRYGFSPAQDQLFVRVSSNRPWREIAAQPTLRKFFENLEPLGL